MNNQEIVALIRDDLTTVEVTFEGGGKRYTFLAKRELASGLDNGDAVLVDTANGVKVAYFQDESDQIGTGFMRNDVQYRYCYQKVDTAQLEALKDTDRKYSELVKNKRRRVARQNILMQTGLAETDLQALTNTLT